jgi:hypothetical protein
MNRAWLSVTAVDRCVGPGRGGFGVRRLHRHLDGGPEQGAADLVITAQQPVGGGGGLAVGYPEAGTRLLLEDVEPG